MNRQARDEKKPSANISICINTHTTISDDERGSIALPATENQEKETNSVHVCQTTAEKKLNHLREEVLESKSHINTTNRKDSGNMGFR